MSESVDRSSCKHEKFFVKNRVTRLTDEEDSEKITGYRIETLVNCSVCGQPFAFVGIPGGYSPSHPTVNFDGTELRAPLIPSDMPVDNTDKKNVN